MNSNRMQKAGRAATFRVVAIGVVLYWLMQTVVAYFKGGPDAPDLTLLLDLSPEQGSARTHARAAVENDRFDSETETFHQKIRAGFLDLAKAEPERFAIVDATGSIDEVHSAIMEVIHERLA